MFFASFIHSKVTDISGNIGFLQWVQKVMAVGCNWLISIYVVYFNYD